MCNKNHADHTHHTPMFDDLPIMRDPFPYTNEAEWLEDVFAGGGKSQIKLERKRKSVEIESEPRPQLEKRRSSCGPVLSRESVLPKRKRGRPRKNVNTGAVIIEEESKEADCEIPLPAPFQFSEASLKENTDQDLQVFLEQLLQEDGEGAAGVEGNSRSRQAAEEEEPCEDDENKKRSKWTEEELLRLWQGIAKHGNNWTAIRGTCLGRSYCQIKDKGRRCLFLLGWETGRSKVETDSSSLHAKRIANAVLAEMK